jgi:hypothetical protein
MATTTSQRIWEMGNPTVQQNATPKGQLPSISALTGFPGTLPDRTSGLSGLSSPTSRGERDSGAWSSQPQSTRKFFFLLVSVKFLSTNIIKVLLHIRQILVVILFLQIPILITCPQIEVLLCQIQVI